MGARCGESEITPLRAASTVEAAVWRRCGSWPHGLGRGVDVDGCALWGEREHAAASGVYSWGGGVA